MGGMCCLTVGGMYHHLVIERKVYGIGHYIVKTTNSRAHLAVAICGSNIISCEAGRSLSCRKSLHTGWIVATMF